MRDFLPVQLHTLQWFVSNNRTVNLKVAAKKSDFCPQMTSVKRCCCRCCPIESVRPLHTFCTFLLSLKVAKVQSFSAKELDKSRGILQNGPKCISIYPYIASSWIVMCPCLRSCISFRIKNPWVCFKDPNDDLVRRVHKVSLTQLQLPGPTMSISCQPGLAN